MASANPLIPLPPGVQDLTKRIRVNRISKYQYEVAGFGGSADIFCGAYHQKDGSTIDVAIKCIRAAEFDGKDKEDEEKKCRKVARELEIWHTLSGAANVTQLLGIMYGIGPLPAPVCELCKWNLQAASYLERKTPPPRHMQMMTDTLRGLSYMHELKPNPIAHGDIKSHNILVTADEKAIICDFGRSRLPHDQPREQSISSPFGATLRYMSPELFVTTVIGPTPASDMWAYGCLALEILCRIQPYHQIPNDYDVVELIKQGQAPSERPRGPRGVLVNDSLWTALASCWKEQSWRPTSRMFLERLAHMLQHGEVSASPVLMDLFPITLDGPLIPWPDEIRDFKGMIEIKNENEMLASSLRTTVWMGVLTMTRHLVTSQFNVAIKVPRLNVSVEHREPHDHLQHVIRKAIRSRYGVKHRNIVDIVGIDSTFSPHPGLVLEFCAGGSLTMYRKKHNSMDVNSTTRPQPPNANAYSLVCDILEGIRYMHNYPVPIPQGDLTPDNIVVNINGVAKVGLLSIGRIIAAIPAAATLTSSVGPLLPFRWMSPELLVTNQTPSTESDMWAVGCVVFWIFTGLRPYAGHLRDDFAGVESVRGLPPCDISRIDFSQRLGDRVLVQRESSWITNGVWSMTSKCWALDPLLRPGASNFLRFFKSLEGRRETWIPPNVVDLAQKVQHTDPKTNRISIARYHTTWRQYNTNGGVKIHIVGMVLDRNMYTPNWYSKPIQVTVKHVVSGRTSQWLDPRPNIPSVRQEVVIMAQLDHPNICKFIGIDTSHEKVPSMVFEFFGTDSLDNYMNRRRPSERNVGFPERLKIITDVASALVYMHEHSNGTIAHGSISPLHIFMTDEGHPYLSNFTCAVQYIANRPQGSAPLSSIVSTPYVFSRWQSPEYYQNFQHEHDDNIPLPTKASDIWSFGCVILSVFNENHPFFSMNVKDAIAQLRAGISPFPREEDPKIDPRVLSVVRPMLSQDPGSRPTAREVFKETLKFFQ